MKDSWIFWQFMGGRGRETGDRSGGGLALPKLEVAVAEGTEGAVGADLHGADAAVGEAGDFLVAESLEAVEREHLALLEWQLGEGEAHDREVVAGGGAVGGVGRVVGKIVQVGRVARRGRGGGFPEVIGGDLAGEVVDPRGELAFVAI